MEIQDLESYTLFQQIIDSIQLFSEFIVKNDSGLDIKDTFIITLQDQILLNHYRSEEDAKLVLKWFDSERLELIQKSRICITKTEENFSKFKSENPNIKEEVRERIKDLKKLIKFFESLNLEPVNYDCFTKLKKGPDINSDYAGISVTETKYFLI